MIGKFMMRRILFSSIPLLMLMACSEGPKQAEIKKEPPKPPEPVSGRVAFYKMFSPARTWAADLQPMRLRSIDIPDVKSHDGKYGAWEAVFVSPAKGLSRSWTYSVVEAGGNLHIGVFNGPEETYRPNNQVKPFLVAALKSDSDDAYKAAVAKSKEYMEKNPTMPVSIQLELTPRFPDLAWRVIWGESVGTSNYSIFVDATTGVYLSTAH